MILFPASRETLLQLLPKNGVVCEIGVAKGEFSQGILDYTQPKKLHLVDPWVHQEREDYTQDKNNVSNEEGDRRFENVRAQFAEQTKMGQVEIHREFSYDVVDEFPDGYFDWIYVDAVHSYEGAKEDLERFLPKLKPGGLIFGHDYANHPDAVNMGFGVIEAVDEFCMEQGMDFIALTSDFYPSFLLSDKKHPAEAQQIKDLIYYNFVHITEIENHPEHTKIQINVLSTNNKQSFNTVFKPR